LIDIKKLKEEEMMKKKLMLTALSSVLALGVLGACGEVNNEPLEEDPMIEQNDGGGMENNGTGNDM